MEEKYHSSRQFYLCVRRTQNVWYVEMCYNHQPIALQHITAHVVCTHANFKHTHKCTCSRWANSNQHGNLTRFFSSNIPLVFENTKIALYKTSSFFRCISWQRYGLTDHLSSSSTHSAALGHKSLRQPSLYSSFSCTRRLFVKWLLSWSSHCINRLPLLDPSPLNFLTVCGCYCQLFSIHV